MDRPMTIRLAASLLFLLIFLPLRAEGDVLHLPYREEADSLSVGSTIVLRGEQLEQYSSSDIRNILTAIAAGVEVTEHFGGPGVSAMEHIGQYGSAYKSGVTIRSRSPLFLVDNIPVHIDETQLDPQQIASVTIIRDPLEKTLYGASAASGIVHIRTRRGEAGKRYIKVNYEHGANINDRFPTYVNGEAYARLNNIARSGSGMAPLYSRADIAAYAAGNEYNQWYPNIDYRKLMLEDAMSYLRVGASAGGGSDKLQYFVGLGYTGEDDIYKMGPQARVHRVNINANLDVRLNDFITARFGIISTMGVRYSPNYGYSSDHTESLSVTEFPDLLADINKTPAIAFPIYARNEPGMESPWYAVSSQFSDNPYANLICNGSYRETTRKGLFNLGLDIDLSVLTPGLKSMTYAAFDATNVVRIGQEEDYAAYILYKGLDEEGYDALIPQQSGKHSVKLMSSDIRLLDYFSNRLYLVQRFSYDRTFGLHQVEASADYMITRRSQKFITEHRREMNFGFHAGWSYDGRYIVRTAMNVHGTYSLLKPWSFSPSLGVAWVLSRESFLRDVKDLDYLKLRLEGGLLHYDSSTSANRDVDNYHWDNSGQGFGPYANSDQWFGNAVSTTTDRVYAAMLGNPALRLEQRKEVTAGVDARLLSNRLQLSANYWYSLSDGIITEMQNVVPMVAGISSGSLFMNYNVTRYQGAELSASWGDRVGPFEYRLGGWLACNTGTVLKADELTYAEPYRSKVGYPSDAIWGLRYEGRFESDAQAAAENQAFDDNLKAGDFKYRDMNGDGVIDDSDVCVIGNSSPRLIYGVNLYFNFYGVDLTITGTGRAFYDLALTNDYFWNGWGDGNYSSFVLSQATRPDAPRLTWNKVNNNYKTSTYWLTDGGFFKIQTLELGYNFPVKQWGWKLPVKWRIFVRANNLATLSAVKDVDPEALSSGITNYPLARTWVGGLKLTF